MKKGHKIPLNSAMNGSIKIAIMKLSSFISFHQKYTAIICVLKAYRPNSPPTIVLRVEFSFSIFNVFCDTAKRRCRLYDTYCYSEGIAKHL